MTAFKTGQTPRDRFIYDRDISGLITNLHRLNGVTEQFGYDDIGQLTSAQAFEGNGTLRALENLAYEYDAAGNLASRTNNTLIQTFVSGNRNELTSITRSGALTVAGSLDGQVTSLYVGTNQAQIYSDSSFATAEGIPLRDGYNQFVTAGTNAGVLVVSTITTNWLPVTSAFSYDLNGNLLSDSHRTFEYDRANQLKSVTLPGTWKTEYAYDGLGRRRITREYTWGNGWALANEIRYVYDRMLVLQERRSDNITLATYTRGLDLSGSMQGAGGIGGLLARTDHSTFNPQLSTSFYHSDGNGNISTLTDSSGTVVARYLYDPFGRVLGKWGPMADVNRYRFSSKETDSLTGLSYYGYRFYDPNLQRWLNEDPIGEAGGINLYGFVGNDPVGRVDPYGLLFKDFFREIGQGLYDTGMKGGGGGDPNSLGKLWGEMEGVDKDNNVLRDAFGEACGMIGDQGTDAAAGKVAAGGLGYVACKLGKPVKALLGKCGELLKRTDDACVCKPAADTGALVSRAEEIHSALNPIAQEMRTTAALDTSGGRIIAGGGRDLTPAQRALLGPGEAAAKLPGAHAEVTALQHAAENGLTPQAIGVTRAICPECEAAIRASGGTLTSPTTAVWPH